MQQKTTVKHQTYNDGILEYYQVEPTYNDAKRKIGEKKVKLGFLPYDKAYKRNQDITFAESNSKKLDVKVKIPKMKFDTNWIVSIDNVFYECYLCEDSDPFCNYLYLQRVTL